MILQPTELDGVWEVTLEPQGDFRGYLARTYCEAEFAARGLNTTWRQSNVTLTRRRGMLRGLHYQLPPSAEIKLVHCLQGKVYDVVVDVRPASTTHGQWQARELGGDERRGLYIPAGFAHGFQCLTDDCLMFYQMSESYEPTLARGVSWADPELGIPWPIRNPVVSERDQGWPRLRPSGS
jgi:dTDP-4-dehydrorhamnose 3,5-epimerase